MSLRELGEKLGIRPQQVQKYETAENKVSVQLLLQIATALQVPAEHFLEGLQHYPGGAALHSIRAMTREIRKVEEVEEQLLAEQRLAKDGFEHWTRLARVLVQDCRADARLEAELLTNYGQLADRLQALSDLSGALAQTMRRGRGQLINALQALRAPRDDLEHD
jgi:transcriptional regulator with XRE-family HTH domain